MTIEDLLLERGGIDRRSSNFDLVGMLVGAIVVDENGS